MIRHTELYLDAAPERADDLARDLRYLRSMLVNAGVDLGRLAGKIESVAPAGWRGIVSEMRLLQGELMEAARAEGSN